MVRLSVDLIARGTSGYTKKKRDEDVEHYLKRLTHLYLEDKCIDDVVSVSKVPADEVYKVAKCILHLHFVF